MKFKMNCDWCGNLFERWGCQSQGKKHLFCSRQCLADFSNKKKNPDGYRSLKNYDEQSRNMKEINRVMNPSRMTLETRTKLRNYQLSLPADRTKTYAKRFSQLEHIVIAEEILGRKLNSDEVVHHIDENKRNNNLNNLAIMTRSDHTTYHLRIRAFWLSTEVKKYDKKIKITPLSKILH